MNEIAPMRWLRRIFHRPPEPIGRRGEQLAAQWLTRQGYSVLERNATIHDDEVDLIALAPDGKTIVIVEVKTRSDDQTSPEAALSRTKQFRLSRMASRLQQTSRYRDHPLRFDVVAIVWPASGEAVIRHTIGAFQSPW